MSLPGRTKLKVTKREVWGALPPVHTEPLALPAKRIHLSFTGHTRCKDDRECNYIINKIQKQFMDRGFPDIPYNFLIGGDFKVYEGRGWNTKVLRPDISNWKDGVFALGFVGKRNVNDKRTEYIIMKGYKFMHYGMENRYLSAFLDIDDESGILVI